MQDENEDTVSKEQSHNRGERGYRPAGIGFPDGMAALMEYLAESVTTAAPAHGILDRASKAPVQPPGPHPRRG